MTSASTPRRTVRYIRRALEFMDKMREFIQAGYEVTQCNMPEVTSKEEVKGVTVTTTEMRLTITARKEEREAKDEAK